MPDYTGEMREKFALDRFAIEQAGIEIEQAQEGYARCAMAITPSHLNAEGAVMGGAIFTLADFAFAVAANAGRPNTVSLSADIAFLRPGRGKLLTAQARCLKDGRHVCYGQVSITDDQDRLIASVTATGFRKE